MLPRRASLFVTAVAASLVLGAGCSSGTTKAVAGTSTTSTTAATSNDAVGTEVPTAPGGSSSAPAVPRCVTADLHISLGEPGAAAGSRYTPIVFTNAASHPCSLTGYPGVSLLDAAGGQIGQPATREQSAPHGTVVLAPGAVANATIHSLNPGVAPDCGATSVKIRVYVPDERTAVDLPGQLATCGKLLEVMPIESGASR